MATFTGFSNEFMQSITDFIMDRFLRPNVRKAFISLLDQVNGSVTTAGNTLGTSLSNWQPSIYGMIQQVSENAILPIAGMIITFVFCYELISTITATNNMHDLEVTTVFKSIFKAVIAVYLLSHALDFVMAFFDVGQWVAGKVAGASTDMTTGISIDAILATSDFGELLSALMMLVLAKLIMWLLSIFITLAVWIRFFEMYLYASLAPIPFATFMNREWGTMGTNYVRKILALAFQAFIMLLCIAIYSALISSLGSSSDFYAALTKAIAGGLCLTLVLWRSGTISNSIFSAQ